MFLVAIKDVHCRCLERQGQCLGASGEETRDTSKIKLL